MKKFFLFLSASVVCGLVFISGCSKTSDPMPCDGKGTLYIENKLDSTLVVTIKTTHDQFTVKKDYIHTSSLNGEVTYAINISSTGIDKDTNITVLSCDRKLLIVQ